MPKTKPDDLPSRVEIINGREYVPLTDLQKVTARIRTAKSAEKQRRFLLHVLRLIRLHPKHRAKLEPFLTRKPTEKAKRELVAVLATPYDSVRPPKPKKVKQD